MTPLIRARGISSGEKYRFKMINSRGMRKMVMRRTGMINDANEVKSPACRLIFIFKILLHRLSGCNNCNSQYKTFFEEKEVSVEKCCPPLT